MARYPGTLPVAAPTKLTVRAIAGTRVILLALNCLKDQTKDLMGFAIKRAVAGSSATTNWLKGIKVFKSLDPHPQKGGQYSTYENPIQSFLWSDYTASPDTEYEITVTARYGEPGNLRDGDTVSFTIRTEKADDGNHGIWFNRGSIASQAFASEFHNAAMTDQIANDPANKMTVWLSRGLLEACLGFIDQTPAGDGLRVCAYEFTYVPVLNSLKKALDRGVDVQIIYHKTPANDKAIQAAGLTAKKNGTQVLFERTRPKIPHNKFIVRLEGNRNPVSVWTGSTNFTPSGFLGQTNVGHLVTDTVTPKKYLAFWQELSGNPQHGPAVINATELTPNPPNLIPTGAPTPVFSPRTNDDMLDWYAERIEDAKTSVTFTGAFGVAPKILAGLRKQSDAMRFILLEQPPTADVRGTQAGDSADVRISYGAVLGQKYEERKGAGGKKKLVPIPNFKLDEWFLEEELARQDGSGFVFFIHTKFLLVDPLSDDPLVCTGSANFSGNSLTSNDENMIQIRGNTRVADIYLTEFDRIFRHFYFRDVANELATKGTDAKSIFLSEDDTWTGEYFDQKKFNCHRRLMFFADTQQDWTTQAAKDPNPFGGGAAPKPARRPGGGAKASGGKVTPRKPKSPPKKKSGTAAKKTRSSKKQRVARKTGANKRATKSSTKLTPAKNRKKTSKKKSKKKASKKKTSRKK